jgi:hypothetical protein
MEIKIQQTTKTIENGGLQTHIFEAADSITHEEIFFESKEAFQKLYKSRIEDAGKEVGNVYGIPDWYWKGQECTQNESGSFLFIEFWNDKIKMYQFIVAKQCYVYITNKGQTIDNIVI